MIYVTNLVRYRTVFPDERKLIAYAEEEFSPFHTYSLY